jgi:GTP cyclohydrolase I
MNKIEKLMATLLKEIDTNSTREGLVETPKRSAAFWRDFLSPPEFKPTIFLSEGYDEMVVQTNIPFYSVCEHHLLPFFGIGAIAYIPDKHIIGLSKLSRMLENFSRRLQNQERITSQVAQCLQEATKPKGVGVVLCARHLCMEMRGVRKSNTQTTTSALKGVFKTHVQTRNEFTELIKGAKQ